MKMDESVWLSCVCEGTKVLPESQHKQSKYVWQYIYIGKDYRSHQECAIPMDI